MKKIYLILILIIVAAGIWFISSGQLLKKQDTGLANPASVFCIDNGGRLDIRTDPSGGQVGFCIFKDNTECEEWAYFQNECQTGGQKNNPVACTMEAKQCPDGSYVSRTGPNCEFTPCPGTSISKDLTEKANAENYLRENISKLSPVKAVLGGTWYILSVTVDVEKNSGTVIYEDGHLQETKNFSYTADEKGEVTSALIY
jgi:putative hemolysin